MKFLTTCQSVLDLGSGTAHSFKAVGFFSLCARIRFTVYGLASPLLEVAHIAHPFKILLLKLLEYPGMLLGALQGRDIFYSARERRERRLQLAGGDAFSAAPGRSRFDGGSQFGSSIEPSAGRIIATPITISGIPPNDIVEGGRRGEEEGEAKVKFY
ncbi:unnamed protein product [Prorocentrum cordatum]|uniref:Uncharacterized protein n=1 Tax=Prorocentrum cordatum TaxID=2364126 RepID=A0ABN9RHW4_9DINO|nr:unnamed protein product [Polarella glacialis]